jgi:hypothetical protein
MPNRGCAICFSVPDGSAVTGLRGREAWRRFSRISESRCKLCFKSATGSLTGIRARSRCAGSAPTQPGRQEVRRFLPTISSAARFE